MPDNEPRCYGAVDEQDNPICAGADVKTYRAREPSTDGEWFTAVWCSDCAATARGYGYKLHEITVPTE